ncbi:MAG: RagB/SusD family nutrient uptake outer membrane protein [Mucilaginibacter sp.]|uniref:RagB/SusD family nutrient uptake outer membrane protein n=1 Tax=Mucilaginibacter sp. TaxID=1882438 RepID=UPI003266A3CF
MKKYYIICTCLMLIVFSSCKKFLDPKPSQSLAVPSTLEDLQALLDDQGTINSRDIASGEISADDYYLTSTDWTALPYEENRRLYTWANDRTSRPSPNDWSYAYKIVLSSNIVLDNIEHIDRNTANQTTWDYVKGQALFTRAKQFLSIALTWSPAYDPATAATDLGVPLRLTEDFNTPSVRANVQDSYAQVVSDLKKAASLMIDVPVAKTRASRPAAWGLLARTYLAMSSYDSCFKYTNLYLQKQHDLIDYSTEITATATKPFARYNKEVCYDSYISNTILAVSRAKIDSNLYKSYNANDIRKTAFFRNNNNGTYGFKGNYSLNLFGGISTNEVYLMRAECYARLSNKDAALSDLNLLMAKRWKTSAFVPFTATTAQDALKIILVERRKELLMRGLRWMDIKRQNKENANIVLARTVNSQTYTLSPNDLRYALSIPEDVISLSGIPQNRR